MDDIIAILVVVVLGAGFVGALSLVFREIPAQWCNACNRIVTPKKPFNWLVFIFLCGFCYIPIWMAQSAKCPICNSTSFSDPSHGKQKVDH